MSEEKKCDDTCCTETLPRGEQVKKTIRNYMIGSMAAGLIPAPVLDLAAVTGIQLKMIHSIARKYEIPFSEEWGKATIGSLINGLGVFPVAVGVFGSLVKIIPIVGTITGALSFPLMAGATTWAIGKVYVQHFEAGGNMLNFNPEKMKAYFKQAYEEGKLVAEELKPKAEKRAAQK